MDAVLIGQKIKEARLAKKMTQSEVVGTFITRNMLSQIESGAALPSMKTLAYLSSVLDLPLSSLLENESTDAAALPDFSVEGTLAALKQNLIQKNYSEILSTLPDLLSHDSDKDPLYDERAAICARASYETSLLCEAAGQLTEAITHAKNAEQLASLGIYASPALRTDALLLLARLAETLRATIP